MRSIRPGRRAIQLGLCLCVGTVALGSPGESVSEQTLPTGWFLADQQTYAIRRQEGRPAPELRVKEWAGPSRSLFDLRGKIVVIDFWAAWCPYCAPCLGLDAELARTYAERDVEVIAIHDGQHADKLAWKRIAEEQGVRFSHALDVEDEETSTVKRFNVTFFPAYIVIDRSGIIRAAGVRPDRVTDVLDRLLGESVAPVRRAEFPPEFFVGRENRPSSLERMEGQAAPPLQGEAWVDGEAEIRAGGEVTLIQFFSPGNRKSIEALEGLAKQEQALASMGARLVAIAPATCDWESVRDIAREHSWTFPIMRDRRQASPEEGGVPVPANPFAEALGRTADAYSIGPLLPSVVVDRKGLIRAAGFRWEVAATVVKHIALNPEPAPYAGSKGTPTP